MGTWADGSATCGISLPNKRFNPTCAAFGFGVTSTVTRAAQRGLTWALGSGATFQVFLSTPSGLRMSNNAPYLPQFKRAIGSSYLFQRSPGGEQVGGLEVELTFAKGATGTIRVINTLRDSSAQLGDLSSYSEEAIKGIFQYAKDNDIDLNAYDITLSRFSIHDVDSRPYLYYVTAQNALQSALAAWKPPREGANA